MAERIDADKIGSWDMVFDPETVARLADCGVAVLDSPSEVMAPALNYRGWIRTPRTRPIWQRPKR
ncbi:MAG: hypothetical protein M5U35_00930 [Roseovarius sp.]|nr:hypothetical protein [Roseovarius sp.]